MAYAPKYVFRFQSQNGEEFQIVIEKEGYSGGLVYRSLGRAPVLKRERNGHICGTSIEIYAECQVDGEFAELYTSDPKAFRVYLSSVTNSRMLFRGYISPELYSEPDIAPPYDVQIIATDGLGELRRYLYEPLGEVPLSELLWYLLGKTGLPTSFYHNNGALEAGGSSTVPAADFFDNARVNLDYMAGKTCYEVLTAILDSLHVDLFQMLDEGLTCYWQLIRETDVESGASVTIQRSPSGVDYTIVPQGFGSMQSYDWWPVGQMETEVKPACKRLTVISDAQYKSALTNGDMTSDTGWSKTNASYSSALGAYQITSQNGRIAQTITFAEPVRRRLRLQVNLRQYRPTSSAASSAGTASIQITSTLRTYGGSGIRYLLKNSEGEYYWSNVAGSLSVDLPAPAYGEDETACTVYELEIPLYSRGGRDFAMASDLTIWIIRDSASIPLLVHSAALTFEEQIAGYRDVFTFDNGARDNADDVTSLFLPTGSGQYNTPIEFMYGVLRDYDFQAMSVFDQVGEDYARSCCLPRLWKRGTLNVPSGGRMPFVMRDVNGYNYLIQTAEWNLLNSEMAVEILSLPAASVTITGQAISEVTYKGGATNSGGSSSSEGGAPGAPGVTSVGLVMPEAFVVSGSPVTSSGTLRVALGEGRVIPTSNQIHVHTNLPFLSSLAYQMLLGARPTLKIVNKSRQVASDPILMVQHPYLWLGWECSIVLMARHKANKTRRHIKNKGWFAAFGKDPRLSPVIETFSAPTDGAEWVSQLAVKDIIVANYCHNSGIDSFYPYYDGQGGWLEECSRLSSTALVGFNGKDGSGKLHGSMTFGIAIRVDNPEFALQVHGDLVEKNTGSINGVPRYFYSDVAPLTAVMVTEGGGFHDKGEIMLRPF